MATFSNQHLLISPHGSMPGGEQWTVGFRTGPVTDAFVVEGLYASYVGRAWKEFGWEGAQLNGANPPGVTTDGVTVRMIGTDGLTRGLGEYTFATPLVGAGNVSASPNQVALCVTLRSNRPGRTGTGRVYLPALSMGSVNGRVNSGTITTTAAGIASFCDAVTGSLAVTGAGIKPDFLPRICVQSRVSNAAPGPVVQVLVGDVLDTIRGRRSKFRENYVSATLRVDDPTTDH